MKKFFKWFIIVTSLLFVVGVSGFAFYINNKLKTLPPIDTVYLNTYGVTTITDKNGDIIYADTEKVAQPAKLDELPELYTKGLIAVEDADFWNSSGWSLKGTLQGVLGRRGGSTIEQQLIKNTYYNGGRGYDTITRKVHELFLAIQMDHNLSKDEILTYYINKLELGEGTVGAKAAMRVYFNKSPEQLSEKTPENIAQLAYIAGLGQAPTTYDLYNGDDGLDRKNLILSIWENAGLITTEEKDSAKAVDLKSTLAERYHYQTEQKKINDTYREYTQEVLNEARDLGYDLSKTTLSIKSYLDKDVYNAIRDKVMSAEYLDDNQQVGVAVIDTDGIVVGMVGGRGQSDWNHATQTTRSSGSSMKPFTAYGPLFQYFGDKYNTASRFDSSNYTYPGTSYVMRNFAGATYGMVDAQQSLRWSLNTPVARIDDQILGSARMKTFLSGLGLDTKDSYSANDGIGLNISPLQSAAAYNAINSKGVYTKPRFIDSITFVDGTTKKVDPERKQAMNESVAYVLTQMLRGVPKQGIGSAFYADIPSYSGYAGKTGSVAFESGVNNNTPYGVGGSDVWYASITNGGCAVTVWMGYDEPNTSPQIPDSFKGQQKLGKTLQLYLNGDRSVSNWERPSTVTQLSGSDLSAHYAVTDAGDISSNIGASVPDLTTFPNIKGLVPQIKVDANWFDKVGTADKRGYGLYQQSPDDFENDGILKDSVYKYITGKEGN